MDEEFDTSVDTSDVDTSADMDTLDVVDDVPDDIPDDIPEDVPEDEPEMTGEDDLSEDIPEDVPEDEPELTEENDLSDAIPEDVPENEPELTEEDDLSEDIPEDVPDDEPEMTEEDDLPDDISEDVSDDEPEPMENDFTEDIPEDVSDDESESMKDDLRDAFEEQDEDASDNDDSTTDEVSEETTSETEDTDAAEQISDTQDEPLDDTATDEVSEETTSETEDTDAAEQISDTQDEPLNDITTDGTTEDAASDIDNGDTAEPIEGTQDESMDDAATSEGAEDASSDVDNGDSTEPIEDTQDEPMDDTSNKKSADTVETADNTNDTADVNEVNNLSDKVSYLDRMRGDAENALAYDPERKGDWDVVRGRLSDEYRKTSDNLKTLAEGKQAEYEQLRNEYFNTLGGADSPEKAARLAELTKRGSELSKEIDTANSRSRYADNFANELSRDLDPSKRTTYEGVGGKSFTDLHQCMIQKQGNAVKDFKGTCGDCSAANTMTALGDTKSEAEVVQRARDLNACVDKKIPSFLPESLKEKMRGSNGGTSVAGRSQILDSFGYDCDNRANQSLAEISQQIENGKGAIINVDHRVLNKQRDVTAMNPVGTDHALTITGIEKDVAGNAIGLWIHDTGVCSNMGNAFYCNAQDYATWRNTPNCTVQYVSKK